MSPTPPKISILMPSYNQGLYLEAAIRSVLTQDYPHKELILIDGASLDSSPAIIERYRPELAYAVSEPDRGQAHALNKAMARATGEIVGWLNSDDAYLPGAFRRVARAFQRHEKAVLVHGDRLMIDAEGNVLGWTALPAFDPAVTGYTICSETAFWSRSACPAQPFNESLRFAMDVDFFCRLYGPERFVKLNRCLAAFRSHTESKSSTIPEVAYQEGPALWSQIFPEAPEGWRNLPPARHLESILSLVRQPFTVALPYLSHRFGFGAKGASMETP